MLRLNLNKLNLKAIPGFQDRKIPPRPLYCPVRIMFLPAASFKHINDGLYLLGFIFIALFEKYFRRRESAC